MIIQNVRPKFLFFIPAAGLLLFGLVSVYNQNSDEGVVEAAEEKPINCRKQSEIGLPLGIVIETGPNELEMPIGQATDKAEYMAEEIIRQIDVVLAASEEQIKEARTMISLTDGCKANRCDTGCTENTFDCNPYDCDCRWEEEVWLCDTCYETCYRCEIDACSGEACDFGAIEAAQQRIENLKKQIDEYYPHIESFFKQPGINKALGCWWCSCDLPPSCPIDACRTEVEYLMDFVEKSRSGDYLFCDISAVVIGQLTWEHRPLGLNDCVVRTKEWEAAFQGQESFGKIFLPCKEALSAGLIDKQHCYGNTECEAAGGEFCPRAENYYCCE